MVVFIAMVFAAMLDPVRFLVVFWVLYFSRKHEKWSLPKTFLIAIVVSATVSETVLTMIQVTRTWGEGLIVGLVASGVQAVICHRLVAWVNNAKD
jgi:hypothetical protein